MSDQTEAHTYEEAQEAGFVGAVPDPTPNHAYTLEGVAAGEPTPETDEQARAKAKAHAAKLQASPETPESAPKQPTQPTQQQKPGGPQEKPSR